MDSASNTHRGSRSGCGPVFLPRNHQPPTGSVILIHVFSATANRDRFVGATVDNRGLVDPVGPVGPNDGQDRSTTSFNQSFQSMYSQNTTTKHNTLGNMKVHLANAVACQPPSSQDPLPTPSKTTLYRSKNHCTPNGRGRHQCTASSNAASRSLG